MVVSWDKYIDRDKRFGFGVLRGGKGSTRQRIRKDPERAAALAELIWDELEDIHSASPKQRR